MVRPPLQEKVFRLQHSKLQRAVRPRRMREQAWNTARLHLHLRSSNDESIRESNRKFPFFNQLFSQGWQSEGANPACIKDVDECAGNHRPCSVNPWVACRNAPGTFFCDSCPRGYTGNGYYCADIDECQVNNGGCSTSPLVECINTMVT